MKKTKNLKKELFKGWEAFLVKQIVTWTSFLYFDFKYKELVRDLSGKNQKTRLNFKEIAVVAGLVSVSTLVFILPFDRVKTLFQMNHENSLKKETIIDTLKEIFRKEGMTGFYSGWQAKALQGVMKTFSTCFLLDFIETQMENKNVE